MSGYVFGDLLKAAYREEKAKAFEAGREKGWQEALEAALKWTREERVGQRAVDLSEDGKVIPAFAVTVLLKKGPPKEE